MMEYVSLISTVGFPIFVAIWFMVKMEKVVENNTKALERVTVCLEKLEDKTNAV